MTPREYERAREVFLEVLDLDSAERSERIEHLCHGDSALQIAVRGLLAADDRANRFLDQPPNIEALVDEIADRTAAAARTPWVGRDVGRFHITGVIASGGMGVVYEAQQADPDRRVALKVLARGVLSRDSISRFRHEVQILARLNHPGIAQVYEAGTHDDGDGAVPYFAMELVPQATAITCFAQSNGLSVGDRLTMFARVCDAVHFGHQRGVIHRDIKPGNVLVSNTHGTTPADTPHPKVIDFGVARSTGSDLHLTTMHTHVGQIVGTLQYMSPEQFQGDPDLIDTRTDVYAPGSVAL